MADLYNVYDFFVPSPVDLKILASMEVALNLWRQEIRLHVTEDGPLRERYPRRKISLRSLIPEIPSTLLPEVEYYVEKLQYSIPNWLHYHSVYGILKIDILNHFLDFVCRLNGEFDYGKTAKRFVACESISSDMKFKMACLYCLEDDILRIWPEVSTHFTLKEIDSQHESWLYYWVYRLENQWHDLVPFDDGLSLEEAILRAHCDDVHLNLGEWYAIEYLLNRLSSDVRMTHMANMFRPDASRDDELELFLFDNLKTIFFRSILTKLDEPTLGKLVMEKGDEIVSSAGDFRTWDYVKNKMTTDGFCRLVKYIFNDQAENPSPDDCTPHWAELWTTVPDHLKQVAIRDVLLVADSSNFDRKYSDRAYSVDDCRSISFLSAVLSDTLIEDRRTFWNKHWRTLICGIKSDDLRHLTNLCFDYDENQIDAFKNELMLKHRQKIYSTLVDLFGGGLFKETEEFLKFWCSDKGIMKEIRLKLLHDGLRINSDLIGKARFLNKFVDNAYEDQRLVTEFKNKLLVKSEMKIIAKLKSNIRMYKFRDVMEFLDTFAPSSEIVEHIKQHEIMPVLVSSLSPIYECWLRYNFKFDQFEKFISWLFKSYDEVIQFKKALNIDRIIRDLIREKTAKVDTSTLENTGVDNDWFRNCFRTGTKPDSVVRNLLKWYFVTPEALEKFENRYAHDPMFNRLLL